jgi:soluble lytic murein transglycosylase
LLDALKVPISPDRWNILVLGTRNPAFAVKFANCRGGLPALGVFLVLRPKTFPSIADGKSRGGRYVLVKAVRLIFVWIAAALVVGEASAAPPSGDIPLPRPRPASAGPRNGKVAAQVIAPALTATPMVLAPAISAPTSIPPSGVLLRRGDAETSRNATASIPLAAPVITAPVVRASPPLATASTSVTSPLDLAAVKQAIELAQKGRPDEATSIESRIYDPVARKLAEWVILRSDEADLDFPRYAAFIAANPGWPSILFLRRRAEAALWQQQLDPRTVIAFFTNEPARTAKGRFALARALLATGDRPGAQALVSAAWRKDAFSGDTEAQARQVFAGLITPADDKARMDTRFDLEDEEAGLRAANQLGGIELAIAKARSAVIEKSAKAKTLFDEIPIEARRDAGYLFSRIQWLRRSEKISEAAQLLLSAPREPEKLGDVDQWWAERRLVARKLLDLGDARSAYEVAAGAAMPVTENHRAEQQFTAGWIALRFLSQPTIALAHFARVAEGTANPITIARSYYWQGRAAEALGRGQEARTHYETAARYSTAYYGQLARARLGIGEVTLRGPPELSTDHRRLEVARAFEILYALDERELASIMAVEFADKATDMHALAALGEIAAQHNDARAALLIGKTALGHGLPLEHYAFPDFGVPDYEQIGPQVERCVVFSIVRQESAFNPKVISSANALGLMQVTPGAGRDTAKRFNVAFNQHRLLVDVPYNAQIGTAELGNDIASWRGSYILAFVAYNAGPGRAREWIAKYGDPRDPKVDPIDWVERIPLSETRNYVQRVMENMQVYRARLNNSSRLLIDADMRRGG